MLFRSNNGWRTSKKTDVENRDLWEALLFQIQKHRISFYRVKGHVNLKSKRIDTDALYQKFLDWNGSSFTKEDFLKVTEMNNRADALANQGIEQVRGTAETDVSDR